MTSFYTDKRGRVRPISNRYAGRHQARLPSAGIRHEGSLLEEGYNLEEGEDRRHEALRRAVKRYGYAKTVQKVNALAVVNKHRTGLHEKLENDLTYLRREYR